MLTSSETVSLLLRKQQTAATVKAVLAKA